MDRIDVRVEVPVLGPEVIMQAPTGETSAEVAARVASARALQMARQGCLNAALSSAGLDTHAQAEGPALQMLKTASARLGWSGRGLHRVLRLARTIADLQGVPALNSTHVAEAIQFRRLIGGNC
jgi:magnesium chelatase family protein